MVYKITLALLLFCFNGAEAQAVQEKQDRVTFNRMDAEIEDQCGMAMHVPDLKDVYDTPLAFGCIGTYKSGDRAILSMDFEYDPNEHRGGSRLTFVVENVGIFEKMRRGKDSTFVFDGVEKRPRLSAGAAFGESNCGAATNVTVSPIQGSNWQGWIAEEKFARVRTRCRPFKEFTSNYRCIHVMIGNRTMTAQLTGVCLLRRRESDLENGLSYDIFYEMLKSLKFKSD